MQLCLGGSSQNFLNLVSEDVELKFTDLQLGCAYMYVCSKRGRTLSGRSSLKKMEDIIP
jgi:hypothetical protein